MSSKPQQPPRYGPPIALADAKRIMAAAEAEADRNGWPMVITILDSTGHVVMLHKQDHAQFASLEIAEGKARTALNFKRPSKVLEDAVAGGGWGLRFLTAGRVTAMEGGLPLLRNGDVIGAIGVSGMTAQDDVQVAQAGCKALEQ